MREEGELPGKLYLLQLNVGTFGGWSKNVYIGVGDGSRICGKGNGWIALWRRVRKVSPEAYERIEGGTTKITVSSIGGESVIFQLEIMNDYRVKCKFCILRYLYYLDC